MKKLVSLFLFVSLLFTVRGLRAEESPAPTTPQAAAQASPAPVEVAAVASVPMEVTAPAAVSTSTETTAVAADAAVNKAADNLEFVSGEVTAMDETAKTITLKLYGETENSASDKILTVKLDETTDVTDGEKDRDIKSLINGTEVDVEYDPATKKATYIFVY